MLYAMLEGHLMASLFHKRLGAGFKDFLRRYVVSRQAEGAFRSGDPDLVLDFAVGTAVHCATGKYIFGLKKSVTTDEDAVKQLVGFILNGLTEPTAVRLRTNRKNGKGNHAT
jgi:hypothetical protein